MGTVRSEGEGRTTSVALSCLGEWSPRALLSRDLRPLPDLSGEERRVGQCAPRLLQAEMLRGSAIGVEGR